MPATVSVQSGHGSAGGESWSDVTNVRFKAADNDTDDANDPVIRPTSGSAYAYEKFFRLNVTVAPVTGMSNLRFHHASGTMTTGVNHRYGERSQAAGYATPVVTASTIATSTIPTTATVLANDNGTSTGTGMYGPYVVIQWFIGTTATSGPSTAVIYRWTWDEI
jgi:hypothetical protein